MSPSKTSKTARRSSKNSAHLSGFYPELVRKKSAVRGAKQLPRKIKGRLTLKEATLIVSYRLDLPGVMIQVEFLNAAIILGGMEWLFVLGYVTIVSVEQSEKPEFAELHQGSIVGQYGVENFSTRSSGDWQARSRSRCLGP